MSFVERLHQTLEHGVERSEPETPSLEYDPWDDDHKLENPDDWIVNLDDQFHKLSKAQARGRTPAGEFVLLLGPRWAGKSLLLDLTHKLAEDTTNLQGVLESGPNLLREENGVQRVEEAFPKWRDARINDRLDYLFIDDASWTSLLRGRLNQLLRLFSGQPPTLVLSMDFFDGWDLRQENPEFYDEASKIILHPYPRRELLSLWNRYFGSIGHDQELIDEIVTRSLGNPGLLIEQGKELLRVHDSRDEGGSRYMERFWKQGGYDLALQLREGSHFDDGGEATTRERMLIRASQSQQGLTATELSRTFGLERSLCSYHLNRLHKDGLLIRERDGASVVYKAPAPIAVAVENFLVMGYE